MEPALEGFPLYWTMIWKAGKEGVLPLVCITAFEGQTFAFNFNSVQNIRKKHLKTSQNEQ